MAVLQREDGRILTRAEDVAGELAPLGVALRRWPVGGSAGLRALLAKPALADAEKDQVLDHLDHYFQDLKARAGYQARDLIVLHADVPGLDAMLAKFESVHTHSDDEVRYIIDGEGVFGFVAPDGSQLALKVEAEEFINVPAGAPHWFYLTAKRRIKAVRYFTSKEGWVANYTGTAIRLPKLAA